MLKLAYYIAWTVFVIAAVAAMIYDLLGQWSILAIVSLAPVLRLLSHWQPRWLPTLPPKIDWKYIQIEVVSLMIAVPICVLLGMTVDRLAQSLGTWVTLAWIGLCLALTYSNMFRLQRRSGQRSRPLT